MTAVQIKRVGRFVVYKMLNNKKKYSVIEAGLGVVETFSNLRQVDKWLKEKLR